MRRIWRGDPFPLGRDVGRGGHELLALLRARRARRAVPVRRARRRGAGRARGPHRPQLALLPPRRRPWPALRLPRLRPLRPRARPSLQPREAPDRPLREGDRGPDPLARGERAAVRPRRRQPGRRPRARRRGLRAGDAALRRDRPPLRLAGRPAAAALVERDGDLRDARQGHHDACTPACARTCAAPTPASRATRWSPTCASSASPPSSCCRSTTSPTSSSSSSAGSPTTGATARSATSRRTRSTPRPAARGEQIREFKGMVKALHAAGIEVILDVVYNHTAEGNHLGPMLSFRGVDNLAYYRLVRRRAALLHRLHRHRQQPQPAAPERAAPDHGLAALLGRRLPRRRLPLRSRERARARVLRRRPPLGVLRRDPPGPDRSRR